jgi:hypothetical protein
MQKWNEIKEHGFIAPRSNSFSISFRHDGAIYYDGSATHGKSFRNAILGHQKDSNIFQTSGISTTPNWCIALNYALHNKKHSSGVILELDLASLSEGEYEWFDINSIVLYPEKPEDNEILVKRKDNGNFPLELFKIHLVSL